MLTPSYRFLKRPVVNARLTACVCLSLWVLQTTMKLLENSSFEALSSRLCVETGESRILGR